MYFISFQVFVTSHYCPRVECIQSVFKFLHQSLLSQGEMYSICFQVSVTSHYCLRVKRIQSVSRFLSPVSCRRSVLQLGCGPVLTTLAAWLPSAGVIYAMLCSPSSSSPCPVVGGTRSHAQSSSDPHRRLWALRRNHTKEENHWQQNHRACQLLGMKMIVMGISCL